MTYAGYRSLPLGGRSGCGLFRNGKCGLRTGGIPGRAVGLGILDGQPVREIIGFTAVLAGGCFGLSVDGSDLAATVPGLPEILGTTTLGGNGPVV
jgi:hypothetical protein